MTKQPGRRRSRASSASAAGAQTSRRHSGGAYAPWPAALVTQIQTVVARRGIYAGPIDGDRSPELTEAIQQALGRRASGLSPRRVLALLQLDEDPLPKRDSTALQSSAARPDWGEIPLPEVHADMDGFEADGDATSVHAGFDSAELDYAFQRDEVSFDAGRTDFEATRDRGRLDMADYALSASDGEQSTALSLGAGTIEGSANALAIRLQDASLSHHDENSQLSFAADDVDLRVSESGRSIGGTNFDLATHNLVDGESFRYTAGHTLVALTPEGAVHLRDIQNASATAVIGGHEYQLDIPLLNEFLFQRYQMPEMTRGAGFELIPTGDGSRLSFRFTSDLGINVEVTDAGQFFAYASASLDQVRVQLSDPSRKGNVRLELGPYIKVEGAELDVLARHKPYDDAAHHRRVLNPLLMEMNGAEAGIHWEPGAGVMSIQTPGPLYLGIKILHEPLPFADGSAPSLGSLAPSFSYLLNAGVKFHVGEVQARLEGLAGFESSSGLELINVGNGSFELFDLIETDYLFVPATVTAMARLSLNWSEGDSERGLVFLGGVAINPTHMADSPLLSSGPPAVASAGMGMNIGDLQLGLTVSKGTDMFGGGKPGASYEPRLGFVINWGIKF